MELEEKIKIVRILLGIISFVTGLSLTLMGGIEGIFIGFLILLVSVILIFWDKIKEKEIKYPESQPKSIKEIKYPKSEEKREIDEKKEENEEILKILRKIEATTQSNYNMLMCILSIILIGIFIGLIVWLRSYFGYS